MLSTMMPAEGLSSGPTHDDRSALTQELLLRAHAAGMAGSAGAQDNRGQAERHALLHQVILLNRRVAEAVAARYRRRGIPDEDLEQAAYEGLVKAVMRFDPTLRHDLLSFAVPTIRGEVQRYFRDHSWMVRPPRRLQELQWQVNRTSAAMAVELGREPTDAEVRARVGISAQEHGEVVQSFGCFQPASLDQPVLSSPDLTLGAAVADPAQEYDAVELQLLLRPALAVLSERDLMIVRMRYFEDRSQREIGDLLGVTQTQVSRLLGRILRDLHDALTDGADTPRAAPAAAHAAAPAAAHAAVAERRRHPVAA